MSIRRRFVPLAVLLLLALPRAAHACPVCFDPRAENRLAFFTTTMFLTLLPLGMIGGFLLFLRRRARLAAGTAPAGDAPQP